MLNDRVMRTRPLLPSLPRCGKISIPIEPSCEALAAPDWRFYSARHRARERATGPGSGVFDMHILGSPPSRRFFTARLLYAAIFISVCLFVAGCGEPARPVTSGEQEALQKLAGAPPVLHTGEKIHVTVYGEPSLSGQYQVDPGGFVSLPLAGTIKAAGLTQQQLEEQLKQHFSSGYLKDPKITVGVAEFRPFYIVGEVEKPGAYPYTGGLNVLSAVAIAGGTTYRASRAQVLIQHLGENEMRAYDVATPIPILPGDIIQVPRRYF